MKGKPWLRILLALIFSCLIGLGLWNMIYDPLQFGGSIAAGEVSYLKDAETGVPTEAGARTGSDTGIASEPESNPLLSSAHPKVIRFELSFVPAIADFEIISEGKPLTFQNASASAPANQPFENWHGESSLVIPRFGLDLAFVIHWKGRESNAIPSPLAAAFPVASPSPTPTPRPTPSEAMGENSQSLQIGAVRVVIKLPDGRTLDRTIWTKDLGPLTETIMIPGSQALPTPAATPTPSPIPIPSATPRPAHAHGKHRSR
jgi:hypothetical protein